MQCKSNSEGFGVCLSYGYFVLLSAGFVPIIKRDLGSGWGEKGAIKVTAGWQVDSLVH